MTTATGATPPTTTPPTVDLTAAQNSANETIKNLSAFAKISADMSNANIGFQMIVKSQETASQAAGSVKNATRIS